MNKPRGWTEVVLGDTVKVVRGRADPQQHPHMPFIGMDDVEAHTMRILGTMPAGTMKSAAAHFLPGDVLYGRLRPYLNKVVTPSFEGLASAEFIPLTPEPGVETNFVRFRLNATDFVGFTSHLDEGDRPRVDWDGISKFSFALPPTNEQQRIVEAIESYLSRLDAAVASLERVQAKLKAYRASVLKAAVEGRLVPTEAEIARQKGCDYEPAQVLLDRILKERRRRWEEAELVRLEKAGKTSKDNRWKAKYEEPTPPDTSKLPELPEGWCWVTMSALTVSGPQNGLYVPTSKYGSGTPILRIDDYQVDWSRSSGELQRIDISEADAEKYGLIVGDIVINRVNSPSHLGKSLSVLRRHLPAVFESNMMRFGLSQAVVPAFIQHYLSSSVGKQRLTANAKWAVNQASINQRDVGTTVVPLPPEKEQLRIVAEIDRLFSSAHDTAAIAETSAHRAFRLRQAILKWAFEGKLADQNSNDEPAEKLLARIKAERATAAPVKESRSRKAKAAS